MSISVWSISTVYVTIIFALVALNSAEENGTDTSSEGSFKTPRKNGIETSSKRNLKSQRLQFPASPAKNSSSTWVVPPKS